MIWRCLTLCTIVVSLVGCSSGTGDGLPPNFKGIDVTRIPNATPKAEPRSKYGNPPSYKVNGKRYYVLKSSKGYQQRGIASWYGYKFHNNRTSSGDPYDMFKMTAAHPTLPIPSYVRVTNLENGKQIVVRVNDRGPFHKNRIIDLSYVAAKKLDIIKTGTGVVEVQALDPRHYAATPSRNNHIASNAHPSVFLQIGAFSDQGNAKSLIRRVAYLTSAPVRIVRSDLNAAPIFKVRIGPLQNVDEVDTIKDRIETAGLGHAMTVVVPDVQG